MTFNFSKKVALVAVLASVLLGAPAFADVASTKDVVTDTNGNIVKNTFGNCVRTGSEVGTDKCASAQPVAKSSSSFASAIKNLTEKSRSYLVFFDFDKSNVTSEAKSILSKVFNDSSRKDDSVLHVVGHTDRSGSDKYNLALSKRRAEAVKQELVKLGVDANNIQTEAKGESSPLVPTEDGVKEPQNRRAEVTFSYKE
ncbi:MAG: OmpA family protein [Rickettsiaceae bacterium]|jgi:outer membrane protein OmpA-like peptidoglycan-associated protein|nr:OmpA family protein [Rickettsiaceae bacterium]